MSTPTNQEPTIFGRPTHHIATEKEWHNLLASTVFAPRTNEAATLDRTPEEVEAERDFQASLSNGEHEPGDAVPFTDEEIADADEDDEEDINPGNELAYEHLT